MAEKVSIVERNAPQGQRMIEVKLRFWTNDIAPTEGMILPKHALAGGMVRMEPNIAHGIKPGDPIPFHSLLDIGGAIEKTLIAHGIVLRAPRRMKKYFRDE